MLRFNQHGEEPQPRPREPADPNAVSNTSDNGRSTTYARGQTKRINRALFVIALVTITGALLSVGAIQILDNATLALAGAIIVTLSILAWVVLATILAVMMIRVWRK